MDLQKIDRWISRFAYFFAPMHVVFSMIDLYFGWWSLAGMNVLMLLFWLYLLWGIRQERR